MKFDSTGKRMRMMFAKGKWSKIKKSDRAMGNEVGACRVVRSRCYGGCAT